MRHSPAHVEAQGGRPQGRLSTVNRHRRRFTDTNALRALFGGREIATLSGKLPEFVSAVHAYEVSEALTYVKDGKILPHYQA